MGCTPSKEAVDLLILLGQCQLPHETHKGVPRKYQQYNLNAQNLRRALGYAAQYLHSKNQNVLIITVGGAVNTLLLQSRTTTHDVDFFSQELSGRQLETVREAGRYATERSSAPLGEDWLNNATQRMPGAVENIPQLVPAAQRQNDVVFKAPGLTALAAPWDYAFVKKFGRISQGTGREYDPADAVSYLHEYIRRHGGRPVHVKAIRECGKIYRANTPDLVLEMVDKEYLKLYRHHGITFEFDGRVNKSAGPSNSQARRAATRQRK
ncbi:hypothetical protein AJ79_02215 [Helicocarpus griseus UAMH5409]|uniref:DUF7582 domain-containing protein n=1 Tax=Helicocarpus griseus UAMH5409 TaxID=1447875 RepID=A0A2B7XVP1_9EURO|nr:hypothetical protein AJ79_02215 [Helicocarpus griseus UAMH5409]